MKSYKKVLMNLPLPIRRVYGAVRRKLIPHALIDREDFQKVYHRLLETQWWSKEKLEQYQLEQLQNLVEHAYENVPYYHRTFKEIGLKPDDIKSLEDIQKIPILTKDMVRENHEDFIARNVEQDRLRFWNTGGSTGEPLVIYHCKYTGQLYECAYRYRQWSWAGYDFWDKKAWLVRTNIGQTDRVWNYSTHENQLVLASRQMTEENMALFVKKLRQFKPSYLQGIPSAVEVLARYMKQNGIDDIELDGAVFLLAEALYPWQRKLIESQFKAPIFAEYGMSEHAADAVECEQHEGYHVSMEYGIFELLDKNNEPITDPGVTGQVVGTGLHQYVMPFIRYATKDLARYAGKPCSCGRELTLVEDFEGRSREFFVSKTGRMIPAHYIWSDRHPVWGKIKEMNFLQEQEGEVVARIVKLPEFTDSEIEVVFLDEIYKVLGEDEFNVQVNFMDQLPLTTRDIGGEVAGKRMMIEQKLPIGFEQLD
jgi:phenylacetate-CoA ligase